MTTSDLLEECRRAGVTLAPALDYEGPEAAFSGGLDGRLKEQKIDVLRMLVGAATTDPRAGWFGTDWRFEWVQEVGLLYLRLRDSPDAEVSRPEVRATVAHIVAQESRPTGPG